MTSNLDSSSPRDEIEQARRRRSWIRLGLGIVGYAAAMIAIRIWGHLGGTDPWRFAWAGLPLIPSIWIVINIVIRSRQLDEYLVKLMFRGLVVGFSVAIVAAATVGLLGIAGLDLPYAGWIVVLAGGLSWGITNMVTGVTWRF